ATRVYNAVYNDYAECFDNTDLDYDKVKNRIVEITDDDKVRLGSNNSIRVVGVVSDSYGHMLGGTEEEIENGKKIPVGIAGKLYVDSKDIVDINNIGKFVGSDDEEYGGDVIFQPISAKKGTGIDELLDAILVTAEMLELEANPKRYAYGTVLEARLERGEGPKAMLLIQNGTLTNRDFVVAGAAYGKVRRMTNEHNKALKSAGPATPVAIIGLDEVPEAGDNFIAFETEKEAKELAIKRKQIRIEESRGSSEGMKLSDLHKQIAEGETVVVNVIIKADNSGSAEAVRGSLEKINVEGVRLNIIRASAGQITESDVLLASASNAVIFGFNIRPNNQVRDLAERLKIEIHLHRVIYALLEQTEQALKGLLKPEFEEKV
ncbi:MAG TPA: hypothetical protein PK612_04960, partial [Bacilli bacterium]|nr:hypothetical protein [Bacilli bacterium]